MILKIDYLKCLIVFRGFRTLVLRKDGLNPRSKHSLEIIFIVTLRQAHSRLFLTKHYILLLLKIINCVVFFLKG